MPTYRAGTVTLTNNSKTVTGSGTQWANATNGVFPGMMFIGPDGKINIIATVASNTSLTLEDNYTGATGGGQAYKIITTYEGDISQFSARFTALLARFEGNSDVLYTWLTSTAATMTWTKADGTTETIATLSAVTGTVPVSRGGTGATTVAKARENLGLGSGATKNAQSSAGDTTPGALLAVGAFGLGGQPTMLSDSTIALKSGTTNFFRSPSSSNGVTGYPNNTWIAWRGINIAWDENSATQVVFPYSAFGRMWIKGYSGNAESPWYEVLTTATTTKDSNGFIKSASPILRLANSPDNMPDNYFDGFESAGCGAVNDEAVGAVAERNDTGVYLVTGSLGLAVDGWTIEVPQDINGNRLCFVDTEIADNGDITVRVSKRRFDIETGNIVAGEPMDIPDGRWIDLRLSMPAPQESDYSITDVVS